MTIDVEIPNERHDSSGELNNEESAVVIANEFAEVVVRRVFTHNGVRLEISSQRLGWSIRLDALQLESLTWQTREAFSKFLEEPFGPLGVKTSSSPSEGRWR